MSSRLSKLMAAADRPAAGNVLPKYIVGAAMPKAILRKIADIETPAVAVIITVPSRTWLPIIVQGLGDVAPNAIVEEIKSGKLARATDKNVNLIDALGDGRSVIAVTAEPDLLSRDLRAAVDVTIDIDHLNVSAVRKAITAVTNQRVIGLTKDDIQGLDPLMIMAAIRDCKKAREAVARIRQLRTRLIAPKSSGAAPSLDRLPLVGDVRAWADGVCADLDAVAAGTLPISAVRYAVLEGPPGTGKTLLAEALANTVGWRFCPSSVGEWFNAGDGHLGDVTRAATEFVDALLASDNTIGLLDELQSIPNRAALDTRGRDWWVPVVDNVLIQIDRVRKSGKNVLLLGACNHFEFLDAALVRGGRLETRVTVRPPNNPEEARQVLAFYCRNRLSDRDLDTLGNLLVGIAPADIEAGVRRAEALARRGGRDLAIADMLAGFGLDTPIDPELLWSVAIHEAAHAVVSVKLGARVISASILPGAGSRGSVNVDWGDDPTTRLALEAMVMVGLAGRAADEVIGKGASGEARSDLVKASALLVSGRYEMGLYDRLGVSGAAGDEDHHWLEDQLARLMAETRELVINHRAEIERLAQALIAKKALRGDDIATVAGIKP